MTLKREGKSDLNINVVGAWLLAIVSALGILTIAFTGIVNFVHIYEMPAEMAQIKADVAELKTKREDQERKDQERDNEMKASLSVQQTMSAKLDSVCEAVGVPVGANSLANRPSLAYKPSKNENSSQP